MTDTYTDEEEIVHPADPPQQLVEFVGAFQDPQAREAFAEASIRVQDYMVRRDIAADNAAAADRLVSNIGQFKDGLTSMVYADPSAVDLGLDLVPDIVHGIAQTHPYLPDDQRDGVFEGITGDIQREVARSGVMSLADKDATAARALLDNERVAGLLAGPDRLALEGYIGAMDGARTADATALAQQRAVDQQRDTGFAMANYLGALVDPSTQEMQFAPGWAQRVTADPNVPPAATAALLGVYDRLQKGGDAAQSDPFLVSDIIHQIAKGEAPSVPEVLGLAGTTLRLHDAVALARGSVASLPPAVRKEFGDLATTVDAARSYLASPENGPAGQMAFSRFMNWFMTSYPAGRLDPNGERPYDIASALSRFEPNSDDLVRASQRVQSAGERKPLDQILGPRRG